MTATGTVNALPPPAPAPATLDQLLYSLQVMAPGLVHELRNPLSGILAGSQMLGRLITAGPARDYAEIVLGEGRRLEHLLSRLAEFGRLRADGLTLRPNVDLNQAVTDLARGVQARDGTGRIAVTLCLQPDLPAIAGDLLRIRQALLELIDNSCQAMPEGGPITLTTREVPGGVGAASRALEVEVADGGPGFSPEARLHACEPFFSLWPRALGVGLPLALAIARAHGGDLRLGASFAGRGAIVSLVLPVAP